MSVATLFLSQRGGRLRGPTPPPHRLMESLGYWPRCQVDHKPLSVSTVGLFTFTSPAQRLEWVHVLTPVYTDMSTQGHVPTSI